MEVTGVYRVAGKPDVAVLVFHHDVVVMPARLVHIHDGNLEVYGVAAVAAECTDKDSLIVAG
jgi:hypothetical protein